MSPRTHAAAVRELEMLPAETVVTGLPVVTIGIEPDELSRRGQFSWTELDSELGAVSVAVVRLPDTSRRFALSSYRDAPWASVTIEADQAATESDVDALLELLRIHEGEITDRVPLTREASTKRRTRSATSSNVRTGAPGGRLAQPTNGAETSARKGVATRRPRRKGQGTRAAEALSLVQGQPGITIPELAAKMGIRQNYLYRVMPGLEQEGKVRKQGKSWHPSRHAVRA